MTILCRCENIETSEGVPLDVTGVAQVMNLQRPLPSPPKETQAVAGAQDQRKTQGNGSTNNLTSLSVFLTPPWLFSSAAKEGHSAVTHSGFAIKLNSESPLTTGSINEGFRNGLKGLN